MEKLLQNIYKKETSSVMGLCVYFSLKKNNKNKTKQNKQKNSAAKTFIIDLISNMLNLKKLHSSQDLNIYIFCFYFFYFFSLSIFSVLLAFDVCFFPFCFLSSTSKISLGSGTFFLLVLFSRLFHLLSRPNFVFLYIFYLLHFEPKYFLISRLCFFVVVCSAFLS